jgi:hypothetical protein
MIGSSGISFPTHLSTKQRDGINLHPSKLQEIGIN